MSAPVVDAIRTDVPCERPTCRANLRRVTRQAEGSDRRWYDWECPENADHVTQQFEPPYDYDSYSNTGMSDGSLPV